MKIGLAILLVGLAVYFVRIGSQHECEAREVERNADVTPEELRRVCEGF